MKKITILFTLTCICILTSFAQKAAISAYAELGGAGIASANFDMRLQKKEDGLGFKVGIGGLIANSNFDRTTITTIPIGLNYLLGKDNRNYFEMGAGVTFISLREQSNNYYGYGNSSDSKFKSTFGHLYFGYRLQPKD